MASWHDMLVICLEVNRVVQVEPSARAHLFEATNSEVVAGVMYVSRSGPPQALLLMSYSSLLSSVKH